MDIEWTDHDDLEYAVPTENVAAIVVDLRRSTSQVRIYDENDNQVDMVGKKYENRVVMVLWKPDLRFVCYGACRVGQVST